MMNNTIKKQFKNLDMFEDWLLEEVTIGLNTSNCLLNDGSLTYTISDELVLHIYN